MLQTLSKTLLSLSLSLSLSLLLPRNETPKRIIECPRTLPRLCKEIPSLLFRGRRFSQRKKGFNESQRLHPGYGTRSRKKERKKEGRKEDWQSIQPELKRLAAVVVVVVVVVLLVVVTAVPNRPGGFSCAPGRGGGPKEGERKRGRGVDENGRRRRGRVSETARRYLD